MGILNGDWMSDSLCTSWMEKADVLLAADGGADRAVKLGRIPDLVVGDLDSLQTDHALLPNIQSIPDQSQTDCDKLLAVAQGQGIAKLVIIGIEGSRPDHFIASLLSLSRSPVTVHLGFETGMGCLVKPGQALGFQANQVVSLLPLEPCTGVNLGGVTWPLQEASLSANRLVSISNQGLGAGHVSIRSGLALLYVETSERANWEFFEFE